MLTRQTLSTMMILISRVKMSSRLSLGSSGSTLMLVQFQKAITVLTVSFMFQLVQCFAVIMLLLPSRL